MSRKSVGFGQKLYLSTDLSTFRPIYPQFYTQPFHIFVPFTNNKSPIQRFLSTDCRWHFAACFLVGNSLYWHYDTHLVKGVSHYAAFLDHPLRWHRRQHWRHAALPDHIRSQPLFRSDLPLREKSLGHKEKISAFQSVTWSF